MELPTASEREPSRSITFKVGQRFSSYDDFTKKLNKFSKEHTCQFWRRESKTLGRAVGKIRRAAVANIACIYYNLKLCCVYGGRVFHKKTNGVNPRNTKTMRQDCPAYIKLCLSADAQYLEISSMNLEHNHPPTDKRIKIIPSNTRSTPKKYSYPPIAKQKAILQSQVQLIPPSPESTVEVYTDPDCSQKELFTFKSAEVNKLIKMERWAGRVALVTGAASNIGTAICKELLKHGIVVVACDEELKKIQEFAEDMDIEGASGSLHAIQCDLREESEIMDMFNIIRESFGRFDICINNASYISHAPLLDGSIGEWMSMFEINVLALCICTREAVNLMREFNIDDGQVIHINSLSGHKVPTCGSNFYAGTKFMVRSLTEGLRRELKTINSRIRVASISPGVIETDFASRVFTDHDEAAALFNTIECLKAEDIAQTVVYILQSPPHVDVNDIILRSVEQAS